MKDNSKIKNFKRRQARKSRAEKIRIAVIVLLITSITVLFGLTSPPGARFDLWIMQCFYSLRGPIAPPKEVVVAALDDSTYIALNASTRWPFPRSYEADALEKINQAHPKVVILDANLPEENQDPIANARIEQAIKDGPVTIFSGVTPNIGTISSWQSSDTNTFRAPSDPRFERAAKMMLPMWFLSSFQIVSQISATLDTSAPLAKQFPLREPLVQLGRFKIDVPHTHDLINFYGESGTITRIPLHEIIKGDSAKLEDQLRDKVVVIGYQSIRADRDKYKDAYNVPVSRSMFGVEIHATIIGNLIDSSWLRKIAPADEIKWLGYVCFAFSFLGMMLSFRQAICFVLLVSTSAGIACYQLFAHHNFWLPFVGPVIFCGILTLVANQTSDYYSKIKKGKATEDLIDFNLDED